MKELGLEGVLGRTKLLCEESWGREMTSRMQAGSAGHCRKFTGVLFHNHFVFILFSINCSLTSDDYAKMKRAKSHIWGTVYLSHLFFGFALISNEKSSFCFKYLFYFAF